MEENWDMINKFSQNKRKGKKKINGGILKQSFGYL